MTICPTITAYDPHEYREQLERVSSFADRLHIDVMDGAFAPIKSLPLIQTYWPDEVTADIHLMYERPLKHIETLVSLQPQLVIVHAEAEGDIGGMIKHLQQFGIQAGVALLQGTRPADVAELIELADHVLIFSGNLGYHGGTADLSLLKKAAAIQAISPGTEIGWDGGISPDNIQAIIDSGVSVCNVGSAILEAREPKMVYENMARLL